MTNERPARVAVAKLGLDTHDVGAKVVAQALRNAGVEVVFLGGRNTPADLAGIAAQEDVDVIGVSILSGAHRTLVPQLLRSLDEAKLVGVKVLLGGTIPDADADELSRHPRVGGIFGPGSSPERIVAAFRSAAEARRKLEQHA